MSDLPENAITIRGLQKTYAPRKGQPAKLALKGIDLDIPRGSIFGLLGPNGAGKSTLINIMAGLVRKTGGQVTIWRADLDKDPQLAKASIGVVPQEMALDMFFPPRRLLDLLAGLYGVPKAERRTEELLSMVSLLDKADAPPRSLSGGMRRRLLVAKAMVHNPPILVLDEPTAGVDVELREQLWENVKLLNQRGVTILLTTHYLEEAEELCDRIAIINHGQVVANDTKHNLLNDLDNKQVTVFLNQTLPATFPESWVALAAKPEGPNAVSFKYSPRATSVGAILAAVTDAGFTVQDVATEQRRLEDLFRDLTRAQQAA
jgi:ABC-2 type transport system ATP-binding protein